jgi:hypothetical protein
LTRRNCWLRSSRIDGPLIQRVQVAGYRLQVHWLLAANSAALD